MPAARTAMVGSVRAAGGVTMMTITDPGRDFAGA